MALSQNNSCSGPPDCIIATCFIPSNVILYDAKELKEVLVGHFANFGKIIRVSVTTKSSNKAKSVHVQFSSAVEASNAKQNGNTFPGLNFQSIILTHKQPNTQLLSVTPQPRKPSAFGIVPSPALSPPPVKTIDAYYQWSNNCPAVNIPKSQSNLSAQKPPVAHTGHSRTVSSPSTSLASPYPTSAGSTSSNSAIVAKEQKPNTCVKLEVYQGPPIPLPPTSASSSPTLQSSRAVSHSQPNLCLNKEVSQVSPKVGQIQEYPQYKVIRPTRSLSEILNVDINGLKVVPRVHASDALACRYFYGNYPFPLAQMFGRSLGTVIMPTKSIMDAIKPGMNIERSTLELIWNSIERNAIKGLVQQCAKEVLFQETVLKTMVPEWMNEIESDVVNVCVVTSAESQLTIAENVMMACEDIMYDILGDVCQNLIESAAENQRNVQKMVMESTENLYLLIEKETISKLVKQIALDEYINDLCSEVIDDLIECPLLNGFVRILGTKAIESCSEERYNDTFDSLPSPDSSTGIQKWIDGILPHQVIAYLTDDEETDGTHSDPDSEVGTSISNLSSSSLSDQSDDDDSSVSDNSCSQTHEVRHEQISESNMMHPPAPSPEVGDPANQESEPAGILRTLKRKLSDGTSRLTMRLSFLFKRRRTDDEEHD